MGLSEKDVGITEFVGSRHPFVAIVKQQVTDFVVNEVREDKSVVCLTNCSASPISPPCEIDVTLKRVPSEDLTPSEVLEQLDGALQRLQNELLSVSGGKETKEYDGESDYLPCFDANCVSRSIREFAARVYSTSCEEEPSTDGGDSLVLPATDSKAARTIIHKWIKESLPGVITDTIDATNGLKAIRLRRRAACRPWKRRRTSGKDAVTPNNDVLSSDAYDPREDNIRHNSHSVVDQRCGGEGSENHERYHPRSHVECVLWKMGRDTTAVLTEIARLLRINVNALSHAGTKDKRAVTTQRIRVRGIAPKRLAHLNGAFRPREGSRTIALGNFTVLTGSQNKPLKLGDLSGNRFTLVLRDLNVPTDEAERRILSAVDSVRMNGFINYFGLQRFGSGASSTHETGYAVFRGDFAEVCRRLLLPVDVRCVANGMGELRTARRLSDDALRQFADGALSAKCLLQKLPNWMNIERSIVSSYARGEDRRLAKRDHKAAFGCLPRNLRKMYGHAVQSYIWNLLASARMRKSKTCFAIEGDIIPRDAVRVANLSCDTDVRLVTAEEAQSESIPLSLVLVPVLGSKVPLPETPYVQPAREVVEREKIDFSKLPMDYDVAGTYRWLIAHPQDVVARFVQYRDQSDQLLPTDIEQMLDEQQAEPKPSAQVSRAVPPDTKIVPDCSGEASANSQSKKRGLILSFTLGVAEYATMLVREVTKQESSVDHQIAQQNLAAS